MQLKRQFIVKKAF